MQTTSLAIAVALVAAGPSRALAAPIAREPITLMTGKVSVTAVSIDDDFGFSFRIEVRQGAQGYRFETGIIGVGSRAKALLQLCQTTGWRAGYLFVRTDCGGGNAWRCSREQVFASRAGRLVHLGDVRVADEVFSLGASFRDGMFVDIYDKLEDNDLTSHGMAPAIRLIRRERRNQLSVSLNDTWEANAAAYAANLDAIRTAAAGRAIQPDGLRAAVLFNAALARYCRRAPESAMMAQVARDRLDNDERRRLNAALAQVVSGETPR
jgi:hypothetical protein